MTLMECVEELKAILNAEVVIGLEIKWDAEETKIN